jgi:hypothetical protein
VDAFHDRVLRDDSAVGEDRAFRVQPGNEAAPLELREEPELTQL